MAQYVYGFVIPLVAQVHLSFGQLIRTAQQVDQQFRGTAYQAGASATLLELRRAYVSFNDDLRLAAYTAAQQAERDIITRLKDTQVRDDTGATPHLDTLIHCFPLRDLGSVETGAVGIGMVAELDRAINARTPGYGPYWRAQEYGTGRGEVASQVGRILYGTFAKIGGADPTPPQAQYAGGGGPHPIFMPWGSGSRANLQGARGPHAQFARTYGPGRPGLGTIGHEIQPRQFLRLGKSGAAARWYNEVMAIQQRAIDAIAVISTP